MLRWCVVVAWACASPNIAVCESPALIDNATTDPAVTEEFFEPFELEQLTDPAFGEGDYARTPDELQFSCARGINPEEELEAKRLADTNELVSVRTLAAKRLWKGKSRAYAADVIAYLARPRPGGGQEFRDLAKTVADDLTSASIIEEIGHGEFEWGAWLAFLRPHPDVVPLLIAHLDTDEKSLPEVFLAIGASGDKRALPLLLEHLQTGGYMERGFAAQGLAYFGDPDTEVALIEALRKSEGVWATAEICGALGAIGSGHALKPLREVAQSRGGGAISAPAAASHAIRKIESRLAVDGRAAVKHEKSEQSDAADSR
jgi:hypothetical protein